MYGGEKKSIGEWQVAHCYTLLGRSEPAIYHAKRSLDACENAGVTGFALAYAHSAVARAAACAQDRYLFVRHYELAISSGQTIDNKEDRDLFASDIVAEPWFGMKR